MTRRRHSPARYPLPTCPPPTRAKRSHLRKKSRLTICSTTAKPQGPLPRLMLAHPRPAETRHQRRKARRRRTVTSCRVNSPMRSSPAVRPVARTRIRQQRAKEGVLRTRPRMTTGHASGVVRLLRGGKGSAAGHVRSAADEPRGVAWMLASKRARHQPRLNRACTDR